MNIQIYHKQVIVLLLAVILATMSFLIPLPLKSRIVNSDLSSTTTQSIIQKSVVFMRDLATIKRFSVTVKIPQTIIIQPNNTILWPDSNSLFINHQMELQEVAGDVKIVPITNLSQKMSSMLYYGWWSYRSK